MSPYNTETHLFVTIAFIKLVYNFVFTFVGYIFFITTDIFAMNLFKFQMDPSCNVLKKTFPFPGQERLLLATILKFSVI